MRCGAALTQTCPACGTTNPPGVHFCLRCGAPLARTGLTERRVVSVLFADLVGSTSLTRSLDPEPMRTLMGRFFSTMREEIERHGGTVEKFIGDAVMAVFGLPTAHEDDPERAVRAALAMQRRMAALNAQVEADLHLRIAITTGEVIADPLAAASGQFMVTGEIVNLASRLQAQAPPDAIVVDERTSEATRHTIRYETLTPLETREFASQPRWQVVGLAERPAKRLRARLVGREEETRFLLALYHRVVEGHRAHVVTILGAAGVGKTRLVEEFLDSLRLGPQSPEVLRGRCPAYGEGLTYWPLAEMLKQECGIKDNDPSIIAAQKLRESVLKVCAPVVGAEESELIATNLATILGTEFPRDYETLWRSRLQALKQLLETPASTLRDAGADGEPRPTSEAVLQSLRTFLFAKAKAGPLILVFEDLHWAEQSLLDLLERLGARGAEAAILILCLARPELLERHPTWGVRIREYTALSLAPLPNAEGGQLITELLKGGALPAEVRDAVLARAEGNPFFIEEILRMLIDEGSLVQDGPHWRWVPHALKIRIPDTIHGLLLSRLDLLSPLEKRVIQNAAVVGRTFWLGALMAMDGLNPAEVNTALERLQERDLVEDRTVSSLVGEREFVFKHALIREVAYSTLPKITRSERHLQFAQWLERTVGHDVEKFLEVLAHHYEHAWRHSFETGQGADDLARKAITALRRAGARAAALRTLPEARRFYERALAILRNARLTDDTSLHLELLTERSEVVKWMPMSPAVFEDADTVLRLAPTIGREDLVARAWLNRAFGDYDRGQLQSAEDALGRALDLFRKHNDRQGEAEALEMLGGVTSDLRGSLQTAQQAYREVLALYREMGDGQGMARTMAWLGRTLLTIGNLGEAEVLLKDALELGRRHHERIGEASSLMGLAILAHLKGDSSESIARHHETIALCQTVGDPISEAGARRHLAMHYLRRGQPDEAEQELRAAQVIRRQHGAKPDSSQILRALAEVYLARGEVLTAADHAERALAAVSPLDSVARATHEATLGKVRAAEGRGEEADRLFREALQILETQEYRIDLALTLLKYGEALQMLGQSANAGEVFERARRLFQEMGATNFVSVVNARLQAAGVTGDGS